jgi:lipopolysaccharide export system permease protein
VRILERTGPADLRPRLTSATWGRIIPRPTEDALQLELHDGEIHDLPDDDDPAKYEVIRFATHNLVIRNVERDFQESGRTTRGDREMNLSALLAAAGREAQQRRQIGANTRSTVERLAGRQWALLSADGRPGPLARPGGVDAPLPEASRQAAFRAVREEVKLAAGSAWVQVQVEDSHRAAENRFMVEFHKKLAIPVACVVFALVGLPLALTAGRTGRGVSVTVALAIYLVYYLFLLGGEKLSDRGRLDPAVAMWAANVVLGAVGLPVAVAATRERPLLPAPVRRWWVDRRGPPRESRP